VFANASFGKVTSTAVELKIEATGSKASMNPYPLSWNIRTNACTLELPVKRPVKFLDSSIDTLVSASGALLPVLIVSSSVHWFRENSFAVALKSVTSALSKVTDCELLNAPGGNAAAANPLISIAPPWLGIVDVTASPELMMQPLKTTMAATKRQRPAPMHTFFLVAFAPLFPPE
jgi:hypothetical protein